MISVTDSNAFLVFHLLSIAVVQDQLVAVQSLESEVASYRPQMDELEMVHQVGFARSLVVTQSHLL